MRDSGKTVSALDARREVCVLDLRGGGGAFFIITHLSHGTRSWYSYLTITSHYFH